MPKYDVVSELDNLLSPQSREVRKKTDFFPFRWDAGKEKASFTG